MRNLKRCIIGLLVSVLIINMAAPVKADAVAKKYGVILGDQLNNYQLADNLVVVSPTNNLMVKAYSVCKKLGLAYQYDKASKKITIKNPVNNKSLVFILGSKSYTYYSGKGSAGKVKSAAYKCHYNNTAKCNVIHMSTLKYILNYNYYNNLKDTYYGKMGYKALIAYSFNGYSSTDIPITEDVIEFINARTYTDKDELLDAIRMNLLARNTKVELKTNIGVMDGIGINNLFELVMDIDDPDTARDADYLSLLINSVKSQWSYTVYEYSNGRKVKGAAGDPASVTQIADYETTLSQERAVDSKLMEIIKELKLDNASDYEKVKKIHDYIINLASYDTSGKKSSAYNLLFDKSAVCEGYALVAYRLFMEAGLPSRIISGRGNGEPHAWNIVKVDGKWYNIDVTWDDPVNSKGKQILRYDYFLKSDKDFTNHIRDAKYETAEFLKKYPIAEESYPM